MQIVGVSKHQYYYRSTGKKQGVSASTHTLTSVGDKVSNSEIVSIVKKYFTNLDTQYGYMKMTFALKTEGYIINKKKVYRLMKENNYLGKRYVTSSKTYAKYRKVLPEQPLHVLEMDIKFVWVEEVRRQAYVLTIIDTFTRLVLYHTVELSIKKEEVKQAWEHIIDNHLQPNDCLTKVVEIEVRNDNDKRFSAELVREFFKENHLNQVFTHPYTPQENGHIESFHSILSKHLKPYHFWSLEELKQNLILFYEFYNNRRIHGSIGYTSPRTFWDLWSQGLIEKKIDKKKRKIIFKLKIPHYEIQQHTGNNELEGSSLLDFEKIVNDDKKMISTETSKQLTV